MRVRAAGINGGCQPLPAAAPLLPDRVPLLPDRVPHSSFLPAIRLPLDAVLSHRLGLNLFAPDADADLDAIRRSYRAFVAWRMECDRHEAAQREGTAADSDRPDPPQVVGGHRPWAESFPGLGLVPAPLGDIGTPRRRGPRKPPDLGDIARRTLAELGLDVDLDLVRSPFKGRKEAQARREIARRQSDAGHPNHAIARYLRASPTSCESAVRLHHPRGSEPPDGRVKPPERGARTRRNEE